jgi:hypothetical protein
MAAWVLLGHCGYLRPSTNMNLRKVCLVEPVRGASRHWGLLLHASEFGQRSKTGSTDDAVLLDNEDLKWMDVIYPVLKAGNPRERLWSFTYPQLAMEFKRAVTSLDLDAVPYQLRQSGPSWDRLQNRRTLEEIQKRGQWKAFSSVARYEKSTRVMATYGKLPQETRNRCERLTRDLERLMLEGMANGRVVKTIGGVTRRGLR